MKCLNCKKKFTHKRNTKKYCSDGCRVYAFHKRNGRKKIEKMLFRIFRLCDMTVWVDDWWDFDAGFKEIAKEYGFDMEKIYYKQHKKHEKEIHGKHKNPLVLRGEDAKKFLRQIKKNETKAFPKENCKELQQI